MFIKPDILRQLRYLKILREDQVKATYKSSLNLLGLNNTSKKTLFKTLFETRKNLYIVEQILFDNFIIKLSQIEEYEKNKF